MRPLNLLHVTPAYMPSVRYGGPAVSVHGLCRSLAARGHDVLVLTTNLNGGGVADVPLRREVDLDGVRVMYFPVRMLRRVFYSGVLARVAWQHARTADLVHAHTMFTWPTVVASRTARLRRVPYVISPRGMLVPAMLDMKSPRLKQAWLRLFDRQTVLRAAAVHLTSELELNDLVAAGFQPQRTFVVPNGVDACQAADGDSRKSRSVLYMGRLSWKKGLDLLVEAMALVPAAELIVAGNDEEELTPQLRALAGRAKVADRIRFVGFLEGAAKRQALASATVFVLPSHSENFGNAVLEAAAHGCPVIVTPGVGLARVVEKSGAGLVVPGDPQALAEAIRAVLDDVDRQRACRAGARALVREFSWEAVAKRMEDQYFAVLDRTSC